MSGSFARWVGGLLVVVAGFAAAPGEAATTRLAGHVLPALAGAETLPASVDPPPLTLTIVLTRDQQAGFERYLRDVYDPASPTYRRFLTQRQVADRFGPSRRTYDRMRHYMRTSGLRIVAESDNRLTLTVQGSRAAVARAFDVQVADYRLGDRTFHATADEPALPRELAAHVQAIGGLSNLAQVQPSKKALRRGFFKLACQLLLAPVAPPLGYKVCLPSDNPTEPYKLCLTAAEQAAENDTDFNYDFFASTGYYQYSRIVLVGESCPPGTVGSAHTPRAAGTSRVETPVSGAGQTIAIVGFDTFEQSDIADYLALLGLPAIRLDDLSHVRVNGGAPLGPDQNEVLLDVTTAMTVAPKAKMVVVRRTVHGRGRASRRSSTRRSAAAPRSSATAGPTARTRPRSPTCRASTPSSRAPRRQASASSTAPATRAARASTAARTRSPCRPARRTRPRSAARRSRAGRGRRTPARPGGTARPRHHRRARAASA